ncbi:MAG: ABC transporter substrate-binding protein, partial [Phycisphaerales bacterium]|nr:ABC transporter substrate-binding protein [Phycisphaerales bacterium]
MKGPQILILVLFAVILGVPFFAHRASNRNAAAADEPSAPGAKQERARLIVVTPHIEQIRVEFAKAFDRWHQRTYGQGVEIDYRTPGGTTEILKLLDATYGAAMQRRIADVRATAGAQKLLDPALTLNDMKAGDADFDIMFGGGTFDHDRLRSRGATVSAQVGVSFGERVSNMVPQTVTLAKPRDGINAATIDQLASIETKVTIDKNTTLTMRVPTKAIEGGARALLPLAEGKPSVDVSVRLLDCERVFNVRISTPPDPVFTDAEMAAIFGENKIGVGQLYQDDRAKGGPTDQQHWVGAALSGFGIVFNRPLHKQVGLSEPRSWNDLRRPEYAGLLAMADPRLSGSVATLYDSILNAQGFDEGFRTLRDASANARSFAAASTQPPMDVSQGDALAGVAIDFYGRFQAQAVLAPGETSETGRLGYIDPPGAVYVDADPVSILRGG